MKTLIKCSCICLFMFVASACVPETPVPSNNGNALHNQTHPLPQETVDTTDIGGGPGTLRFVKYGADGRPIGDGTVNDQTWVWDDNGTEANGRKWSCVLDHKTRLMWEVKQTDGGLRDKRWKYMNTTAQAASGNWDPIIDGSMDNGSCYADPNGNINATCDTESYIASVKASALCHIATDGWQLPSGNILVEAERELMDVLENGDINQIAYYFPNSPVDYHWSRSPNENASDQAWAVHSRIFGDGTVNDKELAFPVRLVNTTPF